MPWRPLPAMCRHRGARWHREGEPLNGQRDGLGLPQNFAAAEPAHRTPQLEPAPASVSCGQQRLSGVLRGSQRRMAHCYREGAEGDRCYPSAPAITPRPGEPGARVRGEHGEFRRSVRIAGAEGAAAPRRCYLPSPRGYLPLRAGGAGGAGPGAGLGRLGLALQVTAAGGRDGHYKLLPKRVLKNQN